MPREEGTHFPAIVTEVNGVKDIWVVLQTQQDQLDHLMAQMDQFYLKMHRAGNSDWVVGNKSRCQVGRLFAAPYSKEGYHRVLVKSLVGRDRVKLFFLDFGTCNVVRRSQLRFLHRDFLKLPVQALEARLWGLDMVGEDTGDKKGRIQSFNARLVELVKIGNNTPFGLMAVVKGEKNSDGTGSLSPLRERLSLWLVDLTLDNRGKMSINEQLVKEGLAVYSRNALSSKSEDTGRVFVKRTSVASLRELVTCMVSRRKEIRNITTKGSFNLVGKKSDHDSGRETAGEASSEST